MKEQKHPIEAIVVFTGESPERILAQGGTQAWALDSHRAGKCRYVVCTQNQNRGASIGLDPTEHHAEAFLVGKIDRLVRSQKHQRKKTNRFVIHISEYARISLPNVWERSHRNPVRYSTLEDLGIDVRKLNFKTMPPMRTSSEQEGAEKYMDTHMKGTTGWFSDEEPEFDSVPAALTINDDGSLTLRFEYPGDGQWNVHLSHDQRWGLMSGDGSCGSLKATITWALAPKSFAPREWVMVGKWIQDDIVSRWWTELVETQPCGERLAFLTGGGKPTDGSMPPAAESQASEATRL